MGGCQEAMQAAECWSLCLDGAVSDLCMDMILEAGLGERSVRDDDTYVHCILGVAVMFLDMCGCSAM